HGRGGVRSGSGGQTGAPIRELTMGQHSIGSSDGRKVVSIPGKIRSHPPPTRASLKTVPHVVAPEEPRERPYHLRPDPSGQDRPVERGRPARPAGGLSCARR